MNANEMALAIVASRINLSGSEEGVVLRALAGSIAPEEMPILRALADRAGAGRGGNLGGNPEVNAAMGDDRPLELPWASSLRSSCGRD